MLSNLLVRKGVTRGFLTAPLQAPRCSTTPHSGPVGVVMLNMGGPSSLDGEHDGVNAFLRRLFTDAEIIPLGPLQATLGKLIARRRTPKIRAQYDAIGGKSPIRRWTQVQGEAMVQQLRGRHPDTQFQAYTMFRYAPPLTEEVLQTMADDGVTRAIAFSQYPHYSCTTTGSSLNHLWRTLQQLGMTQQFQWSLIDRWPTQPTFIAAVAQRVQAALLQLPPEVRHRAVIMFTAHSLPMKVVNRGDPYPTEIAATCAAVMDYIAMTGPPPDAVVPAQDATPQGAAVAGGRGTWRPPHILAWQSKVGFLPWLGPSTAEVLAGLGRQGVDAVVAVPIAFTSDHIETLYEIDLEYGPEAAAAGIRHFVRSEALNDSALFAQALAELVGDHLEGGAVTTPQYGLNCHGCVNPTCRNVMNPIAPYSALRHATEAPCAVPTWP